MLSYRNVITTTFGDELQAGLFIVKVGEAYFKIIKNRIVVSKQRSVISKNSLK